ncbi:MAG: response regulator [Saprospiraceae bacterium]|nr:response regulator [Saprospiraceae bacterium]
MTTILRLADRSKRKALLFWGLVSALSLAAQDYIAKVEYYSVEQGLSHRQVNTIFQDNRGFVWLGTLNGLNRFDGYTFKTYTKEKDGLFFNEIWGGRVDADGWLWLLGREEERICLFHPERGEVLSLEEKFGKSDPQFAASKFWHNMLRGDDGALWLLAKNTNILYRYHPVSGLRAFPIKGLQGIRPVYFSPDKTIWVTTEDDLIVELSQEGKELRRVEKNWLYGDWAISENGILTIPRPRHPVEHFRYYNLKAERLPYTPPGLEHTQEPFPALIFPFDDKGTFVIHDRLIAPQRGTLAQWTFSHHDKNNFLWRAFMRDDAGRYWLGDDFGFYILQIKKNRFQHYLFKKDALPALGNSIRGIVATSDKLFANLESFGLYEHDFRSGKSRRIEAAGAGFGNHALAFSSKGEIFSGKEKSLHRLLPDGTKGERIPTDFDTWVFCEDDTGKMWLGSSSAGLHTLAPGAKATEPFSRYNGFDALVPAFILYIKREPSGALWVCANNGFYKVDPQKGVVARYWRGGAGAYFLPAENFLHFHRDADGVFWFATANGLVRAASKMDDDGTRSPAWDAQSGKVFDRTNSFSNDFIYAVYEDARGRLWLPSDNGIICMDKKTEAVKTYFVSDGITNAEFNRAAHFQAPDGTLYFGGLNGINAFNPADFDDVNKSQADAPLELTAFQQFDKNENRLVDRTREILRTHEILLRPDDRFFNLEVTLLTFNEPGLIQYAWKIEGLDEDWHYQKERQINFGGLPYGTYTLRIKAKAADGQWSKKELSFTLRALRPWYLQTWFLAMMALLLGLGIRGYIRWRSQQHILEQRKLESMVEKATERIEQDKRTIEKQAEELRQLDKVKSNFFANVSHELRTPLTLMLGPISSMLKSGELSNRNFTYAKLAQQNGEQLLKLVGEILDLQKLESKKLELHPKPVLLYPLLKRIAAQFESLAQNKSIAFVFLYRAEKSLQIETDAAKLELVINNLLSNAMKFTSAGERVEFKAEDLAHGIRLTVTDTGKGIHPGDLPRVFDRFFQSRQADAPTEGGTGIGLALVRELSVLFGGSVSVQSPAAGEKGSAFTFEFPKIEVMGAAEQLVEENPAPVGEAFAIPAITENDAPEKPSILLVEDNLDLRIYLQTLLSDKYRVRAAENGQAALHYLSQEIENRKSEIVNLVISDIMMPVMDGFQLLEKLKSDERFRHIPVVLLTARADMQDKIRALRIGVDDYLLKPFEEEELLVRVAALLERYSERRRGWESRSEEAEEAEQPPGSDIRLSEHDAAWLASLETLVAAEAQNDQLSVTWLADQLHLSERHFQRRLKLLTGLSPNAYIKEVRLQEARRLLELRQVRSVKEAAWAVNFRDEKYFAQQFRERFGKYPSEMMH